jgi:hypothetical protein
MFELLHSRVLECLIKVSWVLLPKKSCCNWSTLVGLQNGQVELGSKVFRPGNHSADEKNGST